MPADYMRTRAPLRVLRYLRVLRDARPQGARTKKTGGAGAATSRQQTPPQESNSRCTPGEPAARIDLIGAQNNPRLPARLGRMPAERVSIYRNTGRRATSHGDEKGHGHSDPRTGKILA